MALLQPENTGEEERAPVPGPSGLQRRDRDTGNGTTTRGILRRTLHRSHSYPPAGDREGDDAEREEDDPDEKKRKRKRKANSPGARRRVRFRRGQITVRDSQGSDDEDPTLSDPILGNLSPQQQWHQPRDETERRNTQRGRPKKGGRAEAIESQAGALVAVTRTNALRALRRRRRHLPADVDREIRRAKGPYDARFQAWAWKEILDGNITLEGQAATGGDAGPEPTPPASTAQPPPQPAAPAEPGPETPAQEGETGPHPAPTAGGGDHGTETPDRPETPPTPPPLPVRRKNGRAGDRRTTHAKRPCTAADRQPTTPVDPTEQLQPLPRPTAREEAEEQRRHLALLSRRARDTLEAGGWGRRQQTNRKPATLPLWQRWRQHASNWFGARDRQHVRKQRHFPRNGNTPTQPLHIPPSAVPLRRLPLYLGGSRPDPAGGPHRDANAKGTPPSEPRRGAGTPHTPPATRGRGAKRSGSGGGGRRR